jgi:membrane-associated phospholipid phosphatase
VRFDAEDQPLNRCIVSNVRLWAEKLTRAPRRQYRSARGIIVLFVAAIGVGVASIAPFDSRLCRQVDGLPQAMVAIFDEITNYGKSGWLLFPLGFLLLGVAAAPSLPTAATRVFAPLTVRVAFLFAAIGIPGLFTLAAKQLIGRARPYVPAGDAYVFHPLACQPQFASLPSGHSTTAFAAALAISALRPRASIIMVVWGYAFLIGVSRVLVSGHFLSDVIASVAIGAAGALLVREYFAARGLAFVIKPMAVSAL